MNANHVYINGLGVAVGDDQNFETLTQNTIENNGKLPKIVGNIPKLTKNIALRKMDRLSKLFLLASIRAKDDAQLLEMEKVGTVFNSVFGPLQTNLSLAKYIVDEDIEGVSPSMFANTVNNACVGYVCMELGCKGVSTMLLSSNYVGYAIHLLKSKKAETILAGGAEEYTDYVYDAIDKMGHDTVEGAAVLVLGAEKTSRTYGEILGYSEAVIGEHPYYSKQILIDKDSIENVIKKAIRKAQVSEDEISGILSGAPAILEEEKEVIARIFQSKANIIEAMKSDALGASIGVSLGIASVLLKQTGNSIILVTNLDYSGVYRAFIVKKFHEGSEEDLV